jgi:hypothetical protein
MGLEMAVPLQLSTVEMRTNERVLSKAIEWNYTKR